jgi:apolipoprotein D and lipocalin family protein
MRVRDIVMLGISMGVVVAIAAGSAPPLQTVAHVDLNRYVGKWFEIARYPNWFERKCDRDVTAEYSMKDDGGIRVVNTCVTVGGKVQRSVGTARVVDASTNAKLRVTFFWPFYGKYWVIGLGNQYEYAVVGEPSRGYLWILSRSAAMPEPVYEDIVQQVTAKGYDAKKLVRTKQTK